MSLRQNELNELEQAMQEVQKTAQKKMAEFEREKEEFEFRKKEEQSNLFQMQKSLCSDRENLQAAYRELEEERRKVREMKQETEDIMRQMDSASEICQKIISYEQTPNKKFLEFCDWVTKRMNYKMDYRLLVERLCKDYREEQLKTMDSMRKELLIKHAQDKRTKKNGGIPFISHDVPGIFDDLGNVAEYGH